MVRLIRRNGKKGILGNPRYSREERMNISLDEPSTDISDNTTSSTENNSVPEVDIGNMSFIELVKYYCKDAVTRINKDGKTEVGFP